jgi:putative ABC transport system ATP-binding protein
VRNLTGGNLQSKASPNEVSGNTSGIEDGRSQAQPVEKVLNSPTSQTPVVSIANLNHFFGKGSLRKQVLFNITLQIQPGEIVLMTGPSGSGKTTLLTLIGGLRSPQQGSLQVLGRELRGASKQQMLAVRRQVGYIFQGQNLLKSITARQNVQMSLQLHPEYSQREVITKSEEILQAVGLGEHIHAYPEQLSGGQKQRVAIARALVSHPRLVLADEPTAALDGLSGRNVVELMQHLAKQQGCTILLVTHDNRILDIADRIIRIEDGHLSADAALRS